MSEPLIAPRPEGHPPASSNTFSLSPPFSLLGLVGGWLTADDFNLGDDNALRWLLVFITPLVAGSLGRFLSPRLRSGPLTTGLLVSASTLVAGIINGVLVGFFVAPPVGLFLGLFFGAICAVPFIPALGAVAFAARRVGRARPGSIVDQADRRAVFRAALTVASLATVIPLPGIEPSGCTAIVFPLAASAILLMLLGHDAGAFVRLGTLEARLAAIPEPAPFASPPCRGPGVVVVDFGLGLDEVEEISPAGAVYRERDRATCVFRGSADRARAVLLRGLAEGAAALLLASGSALIRASVFTCDAAVSPLFGLLP
jgi:hypothetical protein